MNVLTRTIFLVLAAPLLASAAATAQAQDFRRFRDHDIHRFRAYDYDVWRHGRWVHGAHDGRFGWWWSVGGLWYFYNAPIYPYPDPYRPPAVIVEPPPPAASGPPPAQTWYYCDNPQGYYPYVTSCQTEWRPVAPTPPRQ